LLHRNRDREFTVHRGPFPIAYDAGMLGHVLALYAGKERSPEHPRWISGEMGGQVLELRRTLLPRIRVFTNLREMDILDFASNTGSTTAVLAETAVGSRITSVDTDLSRLEITRRRLRHHGLLDSAHLLRILPVTQCGDLPLSRESFDFVLASEDSHRTPPVSLHEPLVLELWRVLRPGGWLFVRGLRHTGNRHVMEPLREAGHAFDRPGSADRPFGFSLAAIGLHTDHLCLRKPDAEELGA
jgi:SAM-dependent methyltransferase